MKSVKLKLKLCPPAHNSNSYPREYRKRETLVRIVRMLYDNPVPHKYYTLGEQRFIFLRSLVDRCMNALEITRISNVIYENIRKMYHVQRINYGDIIRMYGSIENNPDEDIPF